VACHILGINAFDQPDVQDNKGRTKNKIEIFQSKGLLEEVNPKWEGEGIKVFTNQDIEIIGWKSSLKFFVNLARPGDYIAINAYLPRNGEMIDALMKLRVWSTILAFHRSTA
jgi:transaldolase/glucose-6-phosphate isomerase